MRAARTAIWLVPVVAAAACGAAACGSSTFAGGNDAGGSDGLGSDAGTDQTVPVIEGGPANDGANDGPSDAKQDAAADARLDGQVGDAPPGDGPVMDAPADVPPPPIDAGCPPTPVDDNAGIFVVLGSADGPSCGTRQNACGTVPYALSRAGSILGKTTVYLAPGSYPGPVALASGIGLSGGWQVLNTTWTHDCDASHVVISVNTGDRVVTATNLVSAATLDTLTVQNNTAAGTGQSLYGVFVTNSSLVVNNVVITVAQGGAGGAGAAGVAGTPGGGPGSCASGNGAPGTPGPAAMPGASGSYSASGFTRSNGTGGTSGTAGANGTPGGATCDPDMVCDAVHTPCMAIADQVCGTGTNGCGGGRGTAGGAGSGGGASIGLFFWGGTGTLVGGTVNASAGGNGGNGGLGGQGGSNTIGGTITMMGGTGCMIVAMNCHTTLGNYVVGTPGGPGGAGGSGGNGGGGSGGDSYAYYAGGGAAVTPLGTSLAFGAPGGGGGPAGSQGATGAAGPHN
jgi:hypothetical protein